MLNFRLVELQGDPCSESGRPGTGPKTGGRMKRERVHLGPIRIQVRIDYFLNRKNLL
jgi:hypothetical protein